MVSTSAHLQFNLLPQPCQFLNPLMPTFVKLFADSVERPEEIDVLRAEAAKARAQERLRQQLSTRQYIHTHAALKRAMARIKAGSGNK